MPRNPNKITERGLKYRAQRAAFYQANRERKLVEMRDYRARNRELIAEKQKAYQKRRFFFARFANLKLRHVDEPVATHIELARLWKKQKGICPFTGVRLNKNNSQLDHIIPLIRGGSGLIENLRWIHRDANYAKRDLTDEQFVALCQKVVSYRE